MSDELMALTALSRARQDELYACYARGDRAAVLDALAEDVVWTSAACPGIPWGGTHRGRAGVEAFFAALDAALAVTSYTVERVIADGEWVTVLAEARGRVHATGREIVLAKTDILRLRDGRVLEFRELYDTAAVRDALQAPRA
ncbi:nuclear transport factor 2 family protein [Roseicella sp. DB1501]|uniref:nuclear transport factor 2 family protein n=1 Tax=Roseicella sp. DB1501 TaxID=2730925 RepID=UPI001490BB9A|nr:nuclear transport factor 2 family protein [Roseicella sp. DB1501]NOG72446.1 SnoaL-like domain-containing protein [Roseicella sp. DB1501]